MQRLASCTSGTFAEGIRTYSGCCSFYDHRKGVFSSSIQIPEWYVSSDCQSQREVFNKSRSGLFDVSSDNGLVAVCAKGQFRVYDRQSGMVQCTLHYPQSGSLYLPVMFAYDDTALWVTKLDGHIHLWVRNADATEDTGTFAESSRDAAQARFQLCQMLQPLDQCS